MTRDDIGPDFADGPPSNYDPDARPVEAINVPKRPGLPYLKQPSKWSCLPTAFAMVLGKDDHRRAGRLLVDIMEQLGRDDERGFHIQEFLGIGASLGIAFVRFEFDPRVEPMPCPNDDRDADGNCAFKVQRDISGDYDYVTCEECKGTGWLPDAPLVVWRPEVVMLEHDGVIWGRRKGAENYHAVAWCKGTKQLLDPEHGIYGLEGFEPVEFWAAFPIKR